MHGAQKGNVRQKRRTHTLHTHRRDGYIDGIAFFAKGNREVDIEANQTVRAIIGQVETDAFRNRPQIKVIKCIP